MLCSVPSVLFVLIAFALPSRVVPSPALLWSNEKLPESPVSISTLSSLGLISDSICKLTNEQIQLHIVAVNDLSIEVIHQSLERGNALLSQIKNEKKQFRFYPNVGDDIYRTVSSLPASNNKKCAHIHFQLASLQTFENLHEATDEVQKTISGIKADAKEATVIALVSHPTENGHLSRQRREAARVDKSNIVLSSNKTCMFYAKNLTWSMTNGTETSKQGYDLDLSATKCVQNVNVTNGNHTWVTLDLVWVNPKAGNATVNMRLIATIIGRYWYLTSATLNNNSYHYFAYGMYSRMDTPPSYSYVCPTATFTRYDPEGKYGKYTFGDKLFIKNFQFQPFNGNGLAFGPPNYCTSFFTSGIWMGITSSLLCLGILLFGVHRLMSIKSNDRFDDPKGKPLVIKAQE